MSWPTEPLNDLLEDVIDRRGITPLKLGSDYTNSGHRVISAKLIKNGIVDLAADEPRFVDSDTYRRWMRTPLLPGDVLLTSEAPLGELAYMQEELQWCLGQRLFCLRPKAELLNGRFLYYALQSGSARDDLMSRATGTTVQGIRQSELLKISVPVPPLETQQGIGEVLSALDDKIELNRHLNETLEAIAQALFQSWFVDFDPVHAKANGEDSDSICQRLGLTPELLALFPDQLVDSELAEIPEGWQVQRVDQILELAYGKALKASERVDGLVPVYGSGGITGHHNEYLVEGPGIIIGRKGTVGSLNWEDAPFWPIDTVFYVVPQIELTYCFYVLQRLGLEKMNTDAAVPGLNRNNVYRLLVASPSKSLREEFDQQIQLLRKNMRIKEEESNSLAMIRDLLLPKLLSGESLISAEGAA